MWSRKVSVLFVIIGKSNNCIYYFIATPQKTPYSEEATEMKYASWLYLCDV